VSTVCVVGLGYIGLPTAAMLASKGDRVVGFDVDRKIIDSVNLGQAHFFEPELDMLLSAAVSTGRLKAQHQPTVAEYYIIAVPTPFKANRQPDLSFVDDAVASIAPFLTRGATIVLESTCPVGTTERAARSLAKLRPDLRFPEFGDDAGPSDVAMAHCPERVLPGRMVHELVWNDRIIGGMTRTCAEKASALYKTFVAGNCFVTDCRTAELVKLVENSFRDVNIAFANELSSICSHMDIDVWKVIELANKHPRVNILSPGAGVGGHCIAVDPWFIVDAVPEHTALIRTARNVNDGKPQAVAREIVAHASKFKRPVVACFGVSYKADVEDVRESPALEIVKELLSANVAVVVCDPLVKALPQSLANHPLLETADAEAALGKADIVAFLVGHSAFRALRRADFSTKIVVDPIGLSRLIDGASETHS
jgi:UDP-N-acetyl-D-mannosaminuronic acid dehydrogenase